MLRKFTVSTLSPKIAQMCEVYWAMKRRICNWTMGDSWCWPLPNVLNRLYSHTWNDMITGMSLTWTDYSFHSGRWRRLSIWIFSFQFWFFLSTTSFLLGTWCIFCISENHSPLLWLWNGNKQSEVEEICCQQLSKLILYFFFFFGTTGFSSQCPALHMRFFSLWNSRLKNPAKRSWLHKSKKRS